MRQIMILSLALLFSAAVWGQGPPKMRTRVLTHMTNTEIEQYLKRNDVIFVALLVYCVLGLLTDALVRLLERRALAWRRGFLATS